MNKKIKVWLTLDPESLRVTMQNREFQDGDFPRGIRGVGWPIREGKIEAEVYERVMTGNLPSEENDKIHRDLWSKNGPTEWPEK